MWVILAELALEAASRDTELGLMLQGLVEKSMEKVQRVGKPPSPPPNRTPMESFQT
jgi:hypothetical protein